MKAMLFAAGRAERLGALTEQQPAALLKVRGRSLAAWQILSLVRAGVTEIVVNHAWQGEQIEATLGDGSQFGARIQYSAEQTALGSAGAVALARARGLLDDAPFIALSCDVYCPHFPFASLLDALEENDPWGTPLPAHQRDLAWIYLVKNPSHHPSQHPSQNPSGDFALESYTIQNRGTPLHTFANVGVYRPEMFDAITAGERADLGQLLRGLAEQGRVGGDLFRGEWVKIDHPGIHARLNAPLHTPLQTPPSGTQNS